MEARSNNHVDGAAVGATISGGGGQTKDGPAPNQVLDDFGTVSGGFGNTAEGLGSTVGGGKNNLAFGTVSTVGGGESNTADGLAGTVGGGSGNQAAGMNATVGGGSSNVASSNDGTVAGGRFNSASGTSSTVGGGSHNTSGGEHSAISGGTLNDAAGQASMVPGGTANSARGNFAYAGGTLARANHVGSFVWSDHSSDFLADTLATTGPNQFLIRATGGVGMGTTDPGHHQLHIFSDSPASGDSSAALGVRSDYLTRSAVHFESNSNVSTMELVQKGTGNFLTAKSAGGDTNMRIGPGGDVVTDGIVVGAGLVAMHVGLGSEDLIQAYTGGFDDLRFNVSNTGNVTAGRHLHRRRRRPRRGGRV